MAITLNSGAAKTRRTSTKDGNNKRSSRAWQVQRISTATLILLVMFLVVLGIYNKSKMLPNPSDYYKFNYGGISMNTDYTSASTSTSANAKANASANASLLIVTQEPPKPPPYTLIDDELVAWRTNRSRDNYYNNWFVNGKGDGTLNPKNADFQGPILDFVIAGFPKCGTTALMRNLAPMTTMPAAKDICTPVDQTTYYA